MKKIEQDNILADIVVSPDNPKSRKISLEHYFRPGGKVRLLQILWHTDVKSLSLVKYAVKSDGQWVESADGIRLDVDKGFIDNIISDRGSRRYLHRVAPRVSKIAFLALRN